MQEVYDSLQIREIFHIEFLRWLGRKLNPSYYALKGGVNLRFFFASTRYSEDMDLDVRSVEVYALKELVLNILTSNSFNNSFKPFGVERVIAPDFSRAKQTSTTQRFKIHLLTFSGQDLFTKIEFSRRGFGGEPRVEPAASAVLRAYKLPPLLVSHYCLGDTLEQKITALAQRSVTQARDIFDLYLLTSQYKSAPDQKISKSKLAQADKNIFDISFDQFRDSVLSYLEPKDCSLYDSVSVWDEIKLRLSDFIKELQAEYE